MKRVAGIGGLFMRRMAHTGEENECRSFPTPVFRGNGRMRGMSAPPGNLFVSDRPWASVCGLTDCT